MRNVSELGEVDAYARVQDGQRVNRSLCTPIISQFLPCHVPRFSRPFVMGIETDVPTREVLVCETLWKQKRRPAGARRAESGETVSRTGTRRAMERLLRVAKIEIRGMGALPE